MGEAQYPVTATELMRSRFAAFCRGDSKWLLETWHPSTRPTSIDMDDNPQWRGLQIVDSRDGDVGQETGIVEFRATYLQATGIGVLHERSRFVCEDGRWYYVDGELLD